MGECFMRFGIINNKLIVPLFLVIFSIIHIFYIDYILDNKANVIITEFSSSIGHISIIIIPYLKCFSNKHKNIKYQKIKKNYVKDYSIFLLTHLINLLLLDVCSELKHEKDETNIIFLSSDVHGIFSIGSIEVIFTIIMSLIYLKDKYFIHHYLSLFIFIVTSIAMDFILDNFDFKYNLKYLFYIISLIAQLFVESANLVYQKYMFDTLYYSPYVACFAFGILFLVYNIGRIVRYEIEKKDDYIDDYFDDIKIENEIFKFISNIFMVFFLYLFMALTNSYFGPNHVIVNDVIANMFIFLFKSHNNFKYYTIIPFLFQFLLLMIFSN